jgi:hypothetical protein
MCNSFGFCQSYSSVRRHPRADEARSHSWKAQLQCLLTPRPNCDEAVEVQAG